MKALTWHGKRDVRVQEVADPEIKEPADERFVYLSDVLPASWQAVGYAEIPEGGRARSAPVREVRPTWCFRWSSRGIRTSGNIRPVTWRSTVAEINRDQQRST